MTNHRKLINVIAHWTGSAFVLQKKRRNENRSIGKYAATYRIYSNKRRLFNFSRHKCGAYRRLFEGGAYLNIVPDKFTFSIFLFNGTLFYLLIFLWTDTKLVVDLGLREKFTREKNPRVS